VAGSRSSRRPKDGSDERTRGSMGGVRKEVRERQQEMTEE
jgi:hypothetical protein